jgi:hypothetical protein
MARYFFHSEDGSTHVDREGIELGSLEEARHQAVRTIGEMLRDAPDELWADGQLKLCAESESGLALFTITVFVMDTAAGMRSRSNSNG